LGRKGLSCLREQVFKCLKRKYKSKCSSQTFFISLEFLKCEYLNQSFILDLGLWTKIYIRKRRIRCEIFKSFSPFRRRRLNLPKQKRHWKTWPLNLFFVVTFRSYFQIKNVFKIFAFQKLFNSIKNIWKLFNGVKNIWCEQCLFFLFSCQTFENLLFKVT